MRRKEEWKGTRDIIEYVSGLDRNSARIVEQTVIDMFVMDKYGGSLTNKINSIGVKNPLFGDYLNFLGNVNFR